MKPRLFALSAVVFGLILVLALTAAARSLEPAASPLRSQNVESRSEYAPGVVLIGLKPGKSNNTAHFGNSAYATDSPALGAALSSLNVRAAAPVFQNLKFETGNLKSIYRLRLSSSSDVMAAIEALKTNPDVAFAEPDYIAHAATVPDDALYPVTGRDL